MSVNFSKLADACKRNEEFKALIITLSKMERGQAKSDLRRLRWRYEKETGNKLSTSDFRRLIETLETVRAGRLQKGGNRAGTNTVPDRFDWDTNYVDMAIEVLGKLGATVIEPPKAARRVYFTGQAPTPQPAAESPPAVNSVRLPANSIRYAFPLRGALLTIDLPSDLTKAEAEQLAALIRQAGR